MKTRLVTVLVMIGLLLSALPALGQDGETVVDNIDGEKPFVRVPVSVTEDGSTIVADITPLSGDLDTVLYLLDNDDQIVAENDDRSKSDTSSLIRFPQADAGQYTLVATRYKVAEGDSSGEFELKVDFARAGSSAEYLVAPEDLAQAGFPTQEAEPEREWTVLVYYGADNNLEPGILNDLNEFEIAGGSDDRMNIIALVDRIPGFTDASGDWDAARLFDVGPDVSADHETTFPPTIDTPPLADLGEVNTGDGQTLAQFLVWGIRHYPAQHYAVAFGSHGAGWQGLITDDTSENDILSLPELQQAFALAAAEAGADKFDLLINDACLMSSVEYFAAAAPYFNYSLASAEIVIDPALDMTELIHELRSSDTPDLSQIGITLVDVYITRDILLRESSDIGYLTHAVTDLNQFDPVVLSIEEFAQVINRSPAVYSTLIGEARANTYTYSGFLGGTTKVDLGSFMRRVITLSTDNQLIGAAEEVLRALDVARIHGNSGERVASATSYYNIYFPDSSKDFRVDYFEQSPLKEWGKMLRNYYNTVTPQVWTGAGLELGFHLPVAPRIRITNVYPTGEANLLTQAILNLEIIGRRISYGDFTVDQVQPDGSAIRLSTERILTDVIVEDQYERLNQWRPGLQISEYYWDVTLPVVSDGTATRNELITFTEDVAFLDGRYREPGSDVWNDVGVVFGINEDYTGGTVQRIINHAPETDALAVIDIAPGSEFQVYSSVVTPDGRVTSQPGNTYGWPAGGLTWEWQPAPNGQYNLGLLITAFGGTTGFASTSVAVNNDGVDPALRGDSWLSVGVSLARPADWSRLSFSPEDFSLQATSPDQADRLMVYFVARVGSDLGAITSGFIENYGVTLIGNPVPGEMAGLPAWEVTYIHETGAGTYNGHGFALFHPSVGVGMIFAAEALDGQGDLATTLDMLRQHLALIDLNELYAAATNEWQLLNVQEETGRLIEYPMRLDWLDGIAEGAWTRYTPGADPASPTFVAVTWAPSQAETARAELDRRVAEVVTPGVSNFETTRFRTYYGLRHTWTAQLYTADRNGQPVTGRMYVTLVEGATYAVWVETPDMLETAVPIFADVFEPVVDGFIVTVE